jgi:hypothetical protein
MQKISVGIQKVMRLMVVRLMVMRLMVNTG